jgi:P27 family predicted phage terminase small subunit
VYTAPTFHLKPIVPRDREGSIIRTAGPKIEKFLYKRGEFMVKPVDLMTGKHMTKEQKEQRKAAEERLKGTSDDIHKIPTYLDADAKRFYKGILKLIGPDGTNLLSDLDKNSLATYSAAMSILKQCQASIKKDGILINGKPNAAVRMFDNYSKIVRSFSQAFGLDPVSRSRLSINSIKSEDELDPDNYDVDDSFFSD